MSVTVTDSGWHSPRPPVFPLQCSHVPVTVMVSVKAAWASDSQLLVWPQNTVPVEALLGPISVELLCCPKTFTENFIFGI